LIKTLLQQKKPSVKQGLPVNRKKLSAEVFTSMLLLLAISNAQLVGVGNANPVPPVYNWTDPPVLSIHSPVNETYVNTFLLNFTVTKPEWWVGTPGINGHDQTFSGVTYYIDDRYYASAGKVDQNLSSSFNYFAYLTNLTDGPHSLTVHAYGTGSVWDQYGLCEYSPSVESSSVVFFTLDTSIPSVSILSPENKTYHAENVTCTVIVNETSYLNCFLDGSLVGVNQTLTGLSDGTHSFSVDAKDEAGNIGYSGTIIFTVDIPKSSPIVPTAWIMIAAVVILTVIGIILLVYFMKRKR
jgi:hypothetical protein